MSKLSLVPDMMVIGIGVMNISPLEDKALEPKQIIKKLTNSTIILVGRSVYGCAILMGLTLSITTLIILSTYGK